MQLKTVIDAEKKELEKALGNVRKRLRAEPSPTDSIKEALAEEERELQRRIGELETSLENYGDNVIRDTVAVVRVTYIEKIGEAATLAYNDANENGDAAKVIVTSRLLRRLLSAMG